MFVSCQKADLVPDPGTEATLGSITAKFTSGPNTGQEATRYAIPVDAENTILIPIPWFFPESANDETDVYMSAMKLEAALANNASISPALGIVDLTKENTYTLTGADGSKRQITITGVRTKSKKSELTFFSIEDLGVTGLIDQNAKTVSLITVEDLSNVNVTVTVSPHASVVESLTGMNLNSPTSITVLAHDGISKTVYQVQKSAPPKIPYGFRSGSQNQAFNLKLEDLGYSNSAKPSLAASGNFVAISAGDGNAPKYYNRSTGNYVGMMTLGAAKGDGAITSDAKGNILLIDQAAVGGTVKIYKTSAMTAAPAPFITWTNTSGFPVGSRLSVNGDLNSKAVIIASCQGTSGAGSKSFVRWTVTGGVAGNAEVVDANGIPYWGEGINGGKMSSRSDDVNDGSFVSYYDGGNDNLYYLDKNGAKALTLGPQTSGNAWGINNNLTDAKTFNNAKYMVLYCPSHFPYWGINSELYVYDVSAMGNFSGNVNSTNALVFASGYGQLGANVAASGDVLIAPTADGYKMQVFTIDFSVGNFASYEFDCVDK
ncbi:hypothetical protein FPE01S_03_01140 [Flavihumibacter petaseus NBRC 106054]|uniref:DUF5018 domain-containing protein n=2 Tax=Flavihumibacter TaxID=1004301 RepID=A0A0E9N2K4_9BACT|nr:hypothetical protein FPE01S_03_01140 [Flavihumibacter petaseus NBRC 106054]